MAVHVRVLGSSSAGNCTVVWDGSKAVMIDCGFNPRYIRHNLKSLNIALSDLSGVLITHTHGDHVNEYMLGCFVTARVPVYCPEGVVESLSKKFHLMKRARDTEMLRTIEGNETEVGSFEIRSFEVPHDSPGGCYGYSITGKVNSERKKITIATDMGYARTGLAEAFADSHAMVIESNHDPDMLENSGRPPWLKQRIREIGHLSNEQCAGFVVDVLNRSSDPPAAVVLAHISQQCNTNPLALRCTREALDRNGFQEVKVLQTHKMLANDIVKVE